MEKLHNVCEATLPLLCPPAVVIPSRRSPVTSLSAIDAAISSLVLREIQDAVDCTTLQRATRRQNTAKE